MHMARNWLVGLKETSVGVSGGSSSSRAHDPSLSPHSSTASDDAVQSRLQGLLLLNAAAVIFRSWPVNVASRFASARRNEWEGGQRVRNR